MNRRSRIPVLTYHSIDDSGSVISVPPNLFFLQMESLSRDGYKTISISEAIDLLKGNEPLPEKVLVITFDDGYQNFYSDAFPVLMKFGFTATVYLISQYCGKTNEWPGHKSPAGLLELMNWSEITEVYQNGIRLGAHTVNHVDLPSVSIESAQREIAESKFEIENRLGSIVTSFAYPYGRFNTYVKQIVTNHFQSAVTTRLRRIGRGCDPFALERIEMYYFRRPQLAQALNARRLDSYLLARRGMRNLVSSWT